jgi:hypothetical protein
MVNVGNDGDVSNFLLQFISTRNRPREPIRWGKVPGSSAPALGNSSQTHKIHEKNFLLVQMSALVHSLAHPDELLALFKYLTSSNSVQFKSLSDLPDPNSPAYSSAICYYFLNKTSRSFAGVIQSLHAELRHPVAVFYLVLRGFVLI